MPSKNENDKIPPGLKLCHTLQGHGATIGRIAWSPDGSMIATPSRDDTIRLWDARTGELYRRLEGHTSSVNSVSWSPDSFLLASGSSDQTVRLWEVETGQLHRTFEEHNDWVTDVAWSLDGRLLASASNDATINIWETETGKLRRTLKEHPGWVTSVVWSPNGQTLASGSADGMIRLWDTESDVPYRILREHSARVTNLSWSPSGQVLASTSLDRTVRLWDTERWMQVSILEGHYNTVRCASFSFDERLLASKSFDETVRLWRCDTQEMVAVFGEHASSNWAAAVAFHPNAPILATLGERDTIIRIWEFDLAILLGTVQATPSGHYSNAKVVLAGDTGVGKSGLALVLTGKSWVETGSTHSRHVWMFDSREIERQDGQKETRETLLWDLAGQPDYRLIHQLHLGEVAVALVVFDTRSQTDPFAGVHYWDRALPQAQRVKGNSALPIAKFLIAARADVGRIGMSSARIESLRAALHFDGYFETSAKEGWGITELVEAIHRAINWRGLPTVSSTELFQSIKSFLIKEKEAGRLLSTVDDLYRAYLQYEKTPDVTEDLRAQFETCIGRVEARGLIQRLSFGNLILLQPELRDVYASAIVNAAKDEPDGLGCMNEEDVRANRFRLPAGERIKDKEQEKLILIATIEELLYHEIVLREQGDDGSYLVFPSQLTRDGPVHMKVVTFGKKFLPTFLVMK